MINELLSFEYGVEIPASGNSEYLLEYVVDAPPISATDEEIESWRNARVLSAWGAASAAVSLLSRRYRGQWPGAILALCDRKGALEIIWRDEQSRVLFEGVIMGAWERTGEQANIHFIGRRQQ